MALTLRKFYERWEPSTNLLLCESELKHPDTFSIKSKDEFALLCHDIFSRNTKISKIFETFCAEIYDQTTHAKSVGHNSGKKNSRQTTNDSLSKYMIIANNRQYVFEKSYSRMLTHVWCTKNKQANTKSHLLCYHILQPQKCLKNDPFILWILLNKHRRSKKSCLTGVILCFNLLVWFIVVTWDW